MNSEERSHWDVREIPPLFGDDPLFPGKTNERQRSVLRRLEHDTGVVVQGPPGTGKTHTIANLVSALLAQGQRVLVTSARDQALTVLRDKLPPAVRDLCVLLLSSARQDGADELERTINSLTDQVATSDPEQLRDEIRRFSARREEVRGRISALTEQVIAVREAEIYRHPEIAPGYAGTLAAIVQRVIDGAEHYSWIGLVPDQGQAASVPPLSPAQAGNCSVCCATVPPSYAQKALCLIRALSLPRKTWPMHSQPVASPMTVCPPRRLSSATTSPSSTPPSPTNSPRSRVTAARLFITSDCHRRPGSGIRTSGSPRPCPTGSPATASRYGRGSPTWKLSSTPSRGRWTGRA